MTLLAVDNLQVTLATARGRVAALRGLSLRIERGQTIGLVGESGSGKSLTALALMGLLPDGAQVRGSIRLEGRELAGLPEAEWAALRGDRVAMVFQEPMSALNPVHAVGRQIGEALRVHRGLDRRAARAEALRLLERVHMPQAAARLDAYPHQLSGGQRQRALIAMALACGPDLLIADEPTTALDVTTQARILDLLAELVRDDGMALLLVSHNLHVIAQQTREVLVMYGGTIVESGPTGDLFAQPAHPYTRALLAARPRRGLPPGARLPTIPGRVPELADMPRGCPYVNRCERAEARCHEEPPMQSIAPAHIARCVRPYRDAAVAPMP